MRARVHCRLFVILARSAGVGVVFRRGPAKWTQVITWNTESDTFEEGQWFRGTLYERRCDLSPLGDKLIYFVAKHHVHGTADPSYTSAWTAISKPPYLTALALWPNNTTYHGGGLFAAEDEVLVNSVVNRRSNPERAAMVAHPQHVPPPHVRISPISFTSGEQLFPKRLVRDGWTLVDGPNLEDDQPSLRGRLVREVGDLRLQLDFDYQRTQYALFMQRRGRWEELPFAGIDRARDERVHWADFDRGGRLVFAREGKLFAARGARIGEELDVDVLADFDHRKPARIIAPAHARTW